MCLCAVSAFSDFAKLIFHNETIIKQFRLCCKFYHIQWKNIVLHAVSFVNDEHLVHLIISRLGPSGSGSVHLVTDPPQFCGLHYIWKPQCICECEHSFSYSLSIIKIYMAITLEKCIHFEDDINFTLCAF